MTDWGPDDRGQAGMFLAFQYPQAIQGVSVLNFLRQALSARKGIDLSMLELRLSIMEWMERLDMDPSFADRYLNEGFSGGEKKRNEILQMAILEPELAVLDETDSGLDIDALRVVAKGVREVREDRTELGVLVITHYQRLLEELEPDRVHLHRRRADRALRRGRAGQGARGVGLHRVRGGRRHDHAARRRRHPQGLPDPRPDRRRPPARLPRLGVVVAEAQRGARRDAELLRDDARQRAPRRVRHRGRGHRALRERPRDRRPLHRRATSREIVFTKNVTEAINLVAYTWGRANLHEGDAILLTELEHHANFVPWLMLREERGIEIRVIPVAEDHTLDLTDLDRLVDGVKLVGVTAMSNVLGTLTPIRRLADAAHAAGALMPRRRRPVHAPPAPPTSPPWTATSTASPATSCSGPPASACCGPGPSCSTPCRRSSAAAR